MFSTDAKGIVAQFKQHKSLLLAKLKRVVPALNTALLDTELTYLGNAQSWWKSGKKSEIFEQIVS